VFSFPNEGKQWDILPDDIRGDELQFTYIMHVCNSNYATHGSRKGSEGAAGSFRGNQLE